MFTFASLLQLLLDSVGHAEHPLGLYERARHATNVHRCTFQRLPETWLPKGLKPYLPWKLLKQLMRWVAVTESFRACSSNVMNSMHGNRELSTTGGCTPQGVLRHPAVRIQAVRQGWVQF